MKLKLILMFMILSVVGFGQKKQSLFNGKNLKGWTTYCKDQSIDPDKYFYVNEGKIETPGVPAGYLLTKKKYSNYHLHVEWCYPEKPTNSGIFLHTNGPDQIWPSHYQCQLKHLNAGDFIVSGTGQQATLGDSTYTSTEKVKPLIPKLHESNEKPAGEWNSFDITCKGNTIEIKVNGLLQQTATNCSTTKGAIGLQAEGSKIQFRNIWIKKCE